MQRIGPEQIEAAARTLALAFHDDPILKMVAPDEAKRAAIAPWFFTTALKMLIPEKQVWANEDTSAVAGWLPPGATDISTVRVMRAGMAMLPFKVGPRRALRLMQLLSKAEPLHKAVGGPHWFLATIGTRPDRQGHGLGSALMKIGTDQADAAGLPCYLETMTDEDVAYYSKRGFEVTGEADVGEYTIRAMVRPPQLPVAE